VGALRAPEPLTAQHAVDQFACGKEVLDRWLKNQALENEKRGASKTYVVCDGDIRVVAYFCLANGSVSKKATPGKLKRRMPEPIPVILLGRLAVDEQYHGRGIGRGMLQDAFFRARRAAEISAARALLVHALDEEAKQFYIRHGFIESPADEYQLMHSLF
jgi:GNAT superfamily N-acetyltransferase